MILLGIPSWNNASTDPVLMVALLAGMATSIVGMWLRWWSYQVDKG